MYYLSIWPKDLRTTTRKDSVVFYNQNDSFSLGRFRIPPSVRTVVLLSSVLTML